MNKAYISCSAYSQVKSYIENKGFSLCEIYPDSRIYEPVSAHPDIFMCRDEYREKTIFGRAEELGCDYPENVKYCAVILKDYFIHNAKFTAPELMEYAESQNLKIINVRQGYTKCSCAVIDEKSVITSDDGIYRALKNETDIDLLKISPGHILLPGCDYGFIGGCCGRAGDETIFCGDIDGHPDGKHIRQFIESRGLYVKSFPGLPLLDIGSIIFE